ncbi:sterol desaturase family protein [Zavarzinia aquatilis]|uniref:Fatty acid hydroxylase n=1 Tax=Zavarzinia aquatilis TaxID=2211142 RepID=A0A317E0L6_9PROT|nr:sterol desaturase family protein [Zavarzinia aquatilis]PWR20182.1 fatty acid hydroxylase [Zavarzinia aquatilis]
MDGLTDGLFAGAAPRWIGPAVLLALILAEAGLGALRHRPAYDLRESLATGVIMLGQRLIGLAAAPLVAGLFFAAAELRPFGQIAMDLPGVLLLFLGVEFSYYWHHRAMHRFRLLWATHGVHHSSTRLNLLAAFRLGWGGQLTGGFLFYLPLVLIGFPPLAVLAMLAANLFYQLFLHLSWLPDLGPLDRVLNTPRNHHVHHASNAICLDRNFGGVTVVFDLLFGTYQPLPAEPLRYGTAAGEATRNPFRIALRGWHDLARRLLAARSFRAAGTALFGRP